MSATRRSLAASRFWPCVRLSRESITSTPPVVSRLPARVINRRLTSSGRDDCATSNRSWTAVETLLTFCPPGPEARTNRSSISPSSIESVSVIRIIAAPGSVAPVPGEAQQHHEQVDEIEVERQRADDRIGPGAAVRHRQRHRLEPLRIVSGQAREHDHADERQDELEAVTVPEHPDERGDDDADEAHEEELPPPGQAPFGDRAVGRERSERPGRDEERSRHRL